MSLEEFSQSENILNNDVIYENKQAIFDSLGLLLQYIRTIRLIPNIQLNNMDMFTIQFVNNVYPIIDNWPTGWNDIKVYGAHINLQTTNMPPVPFGAFRFNQ